MKIIGYIIISDGRPQIACDWPRGGPKGATAQWAGRVTMFPSRRIAQAHINRTVKHGDKKGWPVWQALASAQVVAVYPLRGKP